MRTAIYLAARGGQAEIVDVLAAKGADLEARDSDGRTAATEAVVQRNAVVLKLLFATGAGANIAFSDGTTALKMATKMGSTDIAKILKEAGATKFRARADCAIGERGDRLRREIRLASAMMRLLRIDEQCPGFPQYAAGERELKSDHHKASNSTREVRLWRNPC
jgi:ankyrin repeat protein